jgi:hypothetical protein
MWRSTVEKSLQGFTGGVQGGVQEVTMARLGRTGALVLGALGLGLTITYALQFSVSVNSACMIGVAVGSCVALVLGPRIHRPPGGRGD